MGVVSVVIPCRNEQYNIKSTVEAIGKEFDVQGFEYEIIVVNDGGTDSTETIVAGLSATDERIRLVNNRPPFGFGYAIRKGLDVFRGDIVIIAMADASDDPKDMVAFVNKIREGNDCCFGTRFCREAKVEGYPLVKLILNRMVNGVINGLFQLHYNDTTNAFKAYSRAAINGIKPILSRHFNITVELPLKAIIRGYSYAVIPTSWYERRQGKTKFKLQELGSRYLFIIIYVFLEKWLCGSDYHKQKK